MRFFSRGKPPESPFPDAWRLWLHDNVLLTRTLSEPEHVRLRTAVYRLVTTKYWEGCAGLEMTPEIQVTIAGQAAILVLGLGGYCFDELQTILVYPGSFLSTPEDELGLPTEPETRLGESLRGGPLTLSWWHARWAGRRLAPINVVLHEFAHKLIDLGDPERAIPPLLDPALENRWSRILHAECGRLADEVDAGHPTLFDPSGAESPQEFFCVATETFFSRPVEMRQQHPRVYNLLASFYHQDPASRPVPPDVAAAAEGREEEYLRHVVAESTQLLRIRPACLEAYQERALCRFDLGDREGALEDWSAILARTRDPQMRLEALEMRAEVLESLGRRKEAQRDLDEADEIAGE